MMGNGNNLLYFLAFSLLIGEILSEYNLTVVHIGDFHSHWFEFNEKEVKCSNQESLTGKCFGGFPRLLKMVRDIRKKEKNVLVLSSGEFFLGRSLNPLHGWKIANALVPKLELDAMSLANHDFGSGMLELSAFLYAMNFPVVCANMQSRQTSYIYSRVNKSAIIDVNGERIGVVGYVHPDTLQKSKSVTSVKFTPEIPAIQDEVANLEKKGINKIIALGHSGYHTDLEIAKSVMGVDVVVGGNSDIVMEKPRDGNPNLMTEKNIHGKYPRIHYHNDSELLLTTNKTLVLHIPPHGKYVGVLRLTFDDNGKVIHESGEPVLLDSSIPQDMDTLYFLNKVSLKLEEIYRNSHLPDYDEVLVSVRQDLISGNCRMEECALGNLVTDAMLDTYRTKLDSFEESWGPVDAVLFNSGSIRYPLQKGNITIRDLIHSFYVGDFMNRISLSGKQLRKMMEHSVANFDATGVSAPGTFLQVSGIRVTYDLSQLPGQRVKILSVRCQNCNGSYSKVKANKNYFLLMPSFIARGGDGYPAFEREDSRYFGQPEIVLILEYLRKIKEVIPILDGRINFLNAFESSNITKEGKTEHSNMTISNSLLSIVTRTSSKENIKTGILFDEEIKYSLGANASRNNSQSLTSETPVEEITTTSKHILSQNPLNGNLSTKIDEVQENFEKNIALPFWTDLFFKPKHAIFARKSAEQSIFRFKNESFMLNNNEESFLTDELEGDRNYSRQPIIIIENTSVPFFLKNTSTQDEYLKFENIYMNTSEDEMQTETMVILSEIGFKNFLKNSGIANYSESLSTGHNPMHTSIIDENKIPLKKLNFKELTLNTTVFPIDNQTKNNLPDKETGYISALKDLESSNSSFDIRESESSAIESFLLNEILDDGEPMFIMDEKQNLSEADTSLIDNKTLNIATSNTNVCPEERSHNEITVITFSNSSMKQSSEYTTDSTVSASKIQYILTEINQTSLDSDIMGNEINVKSVEPLTNVGNINNKKYKSDIFPRILFNDRSIDTENCDTCTKPFDKENETSLNITITREKELILPNSSNTSTIEDGFIVINSAYANPNVTTGEKDTKRNLSHRRNLFKENATSSNEVIYFTEKAKNSFKIDTNEQNETLPTEESVKNDTSPKQTLKSDVLNITQNPQNMTQSKSVNLTDHTFPDELSL